jgi:hypothetical protein
MSKQNPERASLAAAIIAHDASARAAQKAADGVAAGARMVRKAEQALEAAQSDLEASKAASVDRMALALADGAEAPQAPQEGQEMPRARLRVSDAEDQLAALRVAVDRLQAESAKAEDAFHRARKSRDAAIKKVVSSEDVERLIAKAESTKQTLETAQLELRYIKHNLVTDGSDVYKRVSDYLFAVIYRNEQILADTNPVVAPWVKLKERLVTDPSSAIPL